MSFPVQEHVMWVMFLTWLARKLSAEGVRKMNCLAVVGAGITNSIATFKKSNVLVIDGCPVDCGKKIMNQARIKEHSYLRVTDLGYEKGKTEVSDAIIQVVFCFRHIFKNGFKPLGFIEVDFENECCTPIFAYVFTQIT